jgi:hypothetical protein
MSFNWPAKDPDEILDYSINWVQPLANDTIVTSTWAISGPGGLTQTTATNTATLATIWLSGGTLSQTYAVKNTIVTAGGRTFDQTVNIKIANN